VENERTRTTHPPPRPTTHLNHPIEYRHRILPAQAASATSGLCGQSKGPQSEGSIRVTRTAGFEASGLFGQSFLPQYFTVTYFKSAEYFGHSGLPHTPSHMKNFCSPFSSCSVLMPKHCLLLCFLGHLWAILYMSVTQPQPWYFHNRTKHMLLVDALWRESELVEYRSGVWYTRAEICWQLLSR
jgi:hypothetical protein